MTNHYLSKFKNLTDWAIRAHRAKEETPTLISMKEDTLREINQQLGTDYKITSLNNWLANRKPIPKDLLQFWILQLIECEVQSELGDAGTEVMRLIKRPKIK